MKQRAHRKSLELLMNLLPNRNRMVQNPVDVTYTNQPPSAQSRMENDLFMVAKTWKQSKCPSIDWIKKMWYIYTMEYYSAIRKDEILPFATTWTDLEIIILSKIRQTEKVENLMISLLCGI